jgi:hypothetical protein
MKGALYFRRETSLRNHFPRRLLSGKKVIDGNASTWTLFRVFAKFLPGTFSRQGLLHPALLARL